MNLIEERRILEERKELSKVVEEVVGGCKKLLEIDNEGIYTVGSIFTKKDYSVVRELLTRVYDNIMIRAN
jgi:hypothetical protein